MSVMVLHAWSKGIVTSQMRINMYLFTSEKPLLFTLFACYISSAVVAYSTGSKAGHST